MQVVPLGYKLLIETRVTPRDIAFIKVGDPANVKVTAYDFSIYGGLTGKVVRVSADSIYDEVERRSEEHTSELQSLMRISYAVVCLKKKKRHNTRDTIENRITHTKSDEANK